MVEQNSKFFHTILKIWIKTKTRKSFIDKNLKMELNVSNPFVYFPIHIEMERSLLLGAPYFINQLEIIRSVAKSLPINFNLVIKEHPGQVMRGWRSKSEYQEIIEHTKCNFYAPKFFKRKIVSTMFFSIFNCRNCRV